LCDSPHVLHSFPTRRSSDLQGVEQVIAGDAAAPTDARGRAILHFVPPRLRYFAAADLLDPEFDPTQFSGRIVLLGVTWLGIVDRSEEHTSELQSRGHLVCRL